jgi:hypothetical protein
MCNYCMFHLVHCSTIILNEELLQKLWGSLYFSFINVFVSFLRLFYNESRQVAIVNSDEIMFQNV